MKPLPFMTQPPLGRLPQSTPCRKFVGQAHGGDVRCYRIKSTVSTVSVLREGSHRL